MRFFLSRNIFTHLLLVLICIFLSSDVVFGDEFEVDTSGEVASHSGSRSVEFINSLSDLSISLMWVNRADEDVVIAEIAPGESAPITTFLGHEFYAETVEDHPRVAHPKVIMIKLNTKEVVFSEPNEVLFSTTTKKRKHPAVKILNQKSTNFNVKFRSLAPAIDVWFDPGNGHEMTFQGSLEQGQESTTNTYEGHVFVFTERGRKDVELARHVMRPDEVLLLISHPDHTVPSELQELVEKEKKFMDDYLAEKGIPWRHYYSVKNGPRPKPSLFMWPAKAVGDTHVVTSKEGHWHCQGSKLQCQSSEPLTLELEVVDVAPKVFIIPNFLSSFEADQIIFYASPKLNVSMVGQSSDARTDSTRTSRNSWISREYSPLTESLSLRAADLLQLDESLLRSSTNVEDMQVVHYDVGQRYDSHHDWGVRGGPLSRYITLLFYLTDQESPDAGGETAFPKGAGGRGFKVHPGKGSAVLFYNLLEDGNGDDLAMHAALPVKKGEKWLANFWVWDPKKN